MTDTGALTTAIELLLGRLSAGEQAVTVRLGLPGDVETAESELTVWPLALLTEQNMAGGNGREPLRLRARLLVSAQGALPAGIALIDRVLAREAAEHRSYLVAEPVPAGLWRELGVRPRLGLLFDVPVQVTRAQPAVPLVRALPQIYGVGLRSVSGKVVGPHGVPLVGIRVTSPEATGATSTDNRGRFTLPAVTADRPVRLRLSGRGVSFTAEIPPPMSASGGIAAPESDEPIVITCDIEEAN